MEFPLLGCFSDFTSKMYNVILISRNRFSVRPKEIPWFSTLRVGA
jgi:hypothetical protein